MFCLQCDFIAARNRMRSSELSVTTMETYNASEENIGQVSYVIKFIVKQNIGSKH